MAPSEGMDGIRPTGLVVILLFIGTATLFPSSQVEPQIPTLCLICGTRGSADLLLNVILFLPLGAYIRLAGVKRRSAISWCLLVSVTIELAQFVVPGRNPNLGDVLANTAGGIAGYQLLLAFNREGLDLIARRGAGLPTLAVVFILAASALLLTPQYPDTTYFGQWTPRLGHLAPYKGQVLKATLGNLDIENGQLSSQSPVKQALASRQPLTAQIVAAPTTTKLASIVSIADDHGREVALLGADRLDLVMRLRLHAAQWRFDQPDFRADDLLTGIAPEDTIGVHFYWAKDAGCLKAHEQLQCNLKHSLGIGWALLLYPEHLLGWSKTLLSAAWLGTLVLPISFSARSLSERMVFSGSVSAFIACAAILPAISLPVLTEWAGLAIGVVAGWGVRRAWMRRARKRAQPSSPTAGS